MVYLRTWFQFKKSPWKLTKKQTWSTEEEGDYEKAAKLTTNRNIFVELLIIASSSAKHWILKTHIFSGLSEGILKNARTHQLNSI